MEHVKTTLGILAVAAFTIGLLPSLIGGASAAISSQTTDTGCTNNGGGSPGGQQPSCTGSGLT
jgi:hypothetical protein